VGLIQSYSGLRMRWYKTDLVSVGIGGIKSNNQSRWILCEMDEIDEIAPATLSMNDWF